jgi:hypothetical protein
MMRAIMSEEKKPVEDRSVTFNEKELDELFPKNFPREKCKPLIKQLVARWLRSRMKEAER